jgi:hypothetical protein
MKSKRASVVVLCIVVCVLATLIYASMAKPSAAQSLKLPEIVALEISRIQGKTPADLLGSGWSMSSKLDFLDAHVIKSRHAQFGGWSGLAYDAKHKRFTAVSDTGHWLSFGRLTQDAHGPLTDRIAATFGPILDAEGNPISSHGARDIEALAIGDKEIYLSYESPTSGLYHAAQSDMDSARFRRLYPLAAAFAALPKGYGIEAMTLVSPPGAEPKLLAIAERPAAGQAAVSAWLIESAQTQARVTPLRLGNLDGYDVSEIAWSPSCGLFGVFRKLTWYGRLKIKLAKLSISAEHAAIDNEEIFSAHSGGAAIDNYEGLAVVDVAPGVCDLYVLSDDNFLPLQKTILMQLRYTEGA